jgi:MYXO-CTERM domain-containing protein
MHKLLIALGTTCLITFAAPTMAQTQTTSPTATNENAAQTDDDEGFDLGWLGLLGLIGLAGLRGRHRDDRTTTVHR